MSEGQPHTNSTAQVGGGKGAPKGNSTQIPAGAQVISTFQGQPISDTDRVENNVPMVSDANVSRQRNWSVENKQ